MIPNIPKNITKIVDDVEIIYERKPITIWFIKRTKDNIKYEYEGLFSPNEKKVVEECNHLNSQNNEYIYIVDAKDLF